MYVCICICICTTQLIFVKNNTNPNITEHMHTTYRIRLTPVTALAAINPKICARKENFVQVQGQICATPVSTLRLETKKLKSTQLSANMRATGNYTQCTI